MEKLFTTEEITATGGANQLSMTAQLTQQATEVADNILQTVLADESFAESIKASQDDHGKMDELISMVKPLEDVDFEYLKSIDGEDIDKMIRSQQSKRSRAKSRAMTMDNYRTMMVGAIAEGLLRLAGNKPKGVGGGGNRNAGSVTYTDEELAVLAEDPDALGRAIRNVQSKKSIAKSKIDFDPEGERWQLLLTAEAQLKDLRAELAGQASTRMQEAKELMTDVDVKGMTAKEAKELLANVQDMLAGR